MSKFLVHHIFEVSTVWCTKLSLVFMKSFSELLLMLWKVHCCQETCGKLHLKLFCGSFNSEWNKFLTAWDTVLLPYLSSFKHIFHALPVVHGCWNIGLQKLVTKAFLNQEISREKCFKNGKKKIKSRCIKQYFQVKIWKCSVM